MSTTTVTSSPPAWKQKAAAKREQVYNQIPPAWRLPEPLPTPKNTYSYLQTSGLLSPAELAITETTSARVLLNKLATKQLSAVAVTTAFCKRAALAQQLIRCCTEMFFAEAIDAAKALDEHLAREGRVKGPLHGLPVSVKDGFDVEGYDSTLGWVSMIGKPAARDCNLVAILRGLGAVVYCKTNVPQSLMVRCPRATWLSFDPRTRQREDDADGAARCPTATTTSSSNRSTPSTTPSSPAAPRAARAP